MNGVEAALPESYEVCRRIHRRRDPTYYWAARRLPAEVRPATHARNAWEAALETGLAGTPPAQPVLAALIDAGVRHDLPLGELRAYMRSMRIDCAPVRISSREELDDYMDGSAGSVGRIMAPLLGVPRRHHGDFGRLGRAFQHANFIRDVREDWTLDRIYLPAEERARFGVEDEDLGRATASHALRALVASEVTRVREAFAAADRWAAPRPIRQAIRLATLTYGRMLDRVEAIDHDVLGRRTGVQARQLPGVALGALRA